ncbi:hypothetical protein [uncultured Tessaracoccus sp.]|uniref:hypothetical protein n=1 Tax=uncultured Tessaracoccus sp. TaxID=905023 RepID=UPI0026071689|nr:hypothetical protein [uncultured Tessaracoccus sp.]
MNLHDQLEELAPSMSTRGLASGVRKRRRRRQTIAAGTATAAVALVAVGAVFLQTGTPTGPSTYVDAVPGATQSEEVLSEQPSSPSTEPGQQLVAGQVTLLRKDAKSPVMMCTAVMQSAPPQCEGPTVTGEIDWEKIEASKYAEAPEFRIADAWVVGHFDSTKQTFTLTQQPTLEQPKGAEPVDEEDPADVPQLCEDPLAGAKKGGRNDRDALVRKAEALPGYVDLWVSDGSNAFNVVVRQDAEGAFKSLREVWQGELCVEAREEVPSREQIQAAHDALVPLRREVPDLRVSKDNQGVMVSAWFIDEATETIIHQLAEAHVPADAVTIQSTLKPLAQ